MVIDLKKIDVGQEVVIVHENKPVTTKISSINIYKRWKNNLKEETFELFVEGVEREVAPEELFESVEAYAKSFLPENKPAGK
ncbi:MAG TPA: hypothetical protein PK605_00435 [Ignavibacteria bacterium]|nr:hypothetical protein [Bacteroidota bacterium]HRE10753.1 hypothetical protein [Ignavibacteria bacterium]HRF66006.1 hypothetical protein [Ignavibacteria bacterium]HRJ02846.1 hypothetical protein [Ignavibacteria bacterium]HRJ84404.1 hypothetical protein [Ignavibacteria bacterium]